MKKIYSLLLLAGICLFGAQNVMATDYYVAHNGVLNGNAWDAAGDQMTETAGVWSCVFTNVSGDIKFKITVGSWGTSFGGECIDNEASDFILSGEDYGDISFSVSGKDVEIFWNPSTGKIWVKEYVTADPTVHLSANNTNVLAGQTITLSAEAQNFSGTPTYAYSYSTDGGESYTSMAGNTMTAGESGTVYTFKVVATYNEETAEATVVVSSVVCTVAGESANIFGEAWAQTLTDNDMDEDGGVFTWKKTVYLSAAETMQFKVVLNHSWSVSYPAYNYSENLSAGYNTITITLDWEEKNVACEVLNYPKVEVAGDFNGGVLEELTYSPSGYLYKNIPVTSGNKAFKLKINDEWKGNSGTMTRTNCENWMFAEDADCYLKADINGDYTFFYQGGKLSVSFPESFTRAAANDNYQSLCVPFDATISNAKAYKIASVGTDYVSLEEKTNLVAGNSYIIKPESVGDIVISKVSEGYEVDAPVDDAIHFGALSGEITVNPNFNPEYPDIYILKDNKLCRLESEAHATVTAGHAFFKLTLPTGGAPALRIVVAENDATGVENIEANETAVKFIENGKLFIRKNGVVYDATGAVVK